MQPSARSVNRTGRLCLFYEGRPAQAKKSMLHNPKHLILEAPHPSPLSAYRGFFGSRPFSQANRFLKAQGIEPVDWQIDPIEEKEV